MGSHKMQRNKENKQTLSKGWDYGTWEKLLPAPPPEHLAVPGPCETWIPEHISSLGSLSLNLYSPFLNEQV